MQCKDISTAKILAFIRECNDNHDGHWCNWCFGDDYDVHLAMPKNIPDNLLLAKMRKLINKGLVDGCACGCRGDYVITDKGREYLD